MEIPVLIERVSGNGYRARAGVPFECDAEGATPEEALRQLQAAVSRKVAGATVASLQLPTTGNPWLALAGTLKDHPLLGDWQQAMAEYRQEADSDPERQW